MPDPIALDDSTAPSEPLAEPSPAESATFDTAVTLPVAVIDTFQSPEFHVNDGAAESMTIPAQAPTPPAVDLGPIQQAIAALDGRVERLPIADLARKVDALQAIFEREIRAEATREKVVDRLHAELQEYKNDLFMKVMRPLILDLIQLHDDMGKRIETDPGSTVAQELNLYRQGIEDALYRQGVEPFQADDGPFDPRRQRAIRTEPTDNPDLSKHIANRIRPGFKSGDRIIRLELVSVFTHKP